jgi:hypothetical protein
MVGRKPSTSSSCWRAQAPNTRSGGRDRAQHSAVHVEQNCPEAALGKERLRHDALGHRRIHVNADNVSVLLPLCVTQTLVNRNQTGSAAAAALQSQRRLPIKYVRVRGIDKERNFVTRFQEETLLDHGIDQIIVRSRKDLRLRAGRLQYRHPDR